jgi:hypothetical protein
MFFIREEPCRTVHLKIQRLEHGAPELERIGS